MKLTHIRWGVRAALFVGVAASIAGNVLHAHDNVISRIISAWSPLALLITIELIARVPVHRRSLAFARWAATALIATIAAWVSYWHMAAVASRYGETGASPYLLPLSVDGLVVVASVCLVELGGQIRAGEQADNLTTLPTTAEIDLSRRMVLQYDRPIGPEPAPRQADKLSGSKPPSRKPHASAKDRVEKAHNRTPQATHQELAKRLDLSVRTVERWRPAKPAELATVNGREPELEGVQS